MVLGATYEQREAKDQCNKFSEKLKQYILRVFQSPEDIIVLVRDLKDPTIVKTHQDPQPCKHNTRNNRSW